MAMVALLGFTGNILSMAVLSRYHKRRRIYAEDNAKVVAAVWGTYLNAALAI